jgi:hypothetical protein
VAQDVNGMWQGMYLLHQGITCANVGMRTQPTAKACPRQRQGSLPACGSAAQQPNSRNIRPGETTTNSPDAPRREARPEDKRWRSAGPGLQPGRGSEHPHNRKHNPSNMGPTMTATAPNSPFLAPLASALPMPPTFEGNAGELNGCVEAL